ncbi:hypothetical protein [Paenibacillus sp. FSL H8-0332]|uniref:hypothetical protein n=1 Tax=Paenibacillus sp. FSL H8-0332 TaxID=2954742 RepID=UPI0030D33E74
MIEVEPDRKDIKEIVFWLRGEPYHKYGEIIPWQALSPGTVILIKPKDQIYKENSGVGITSLTPLLF